ncbi:MAG: hypothetical protein WC969_09240 [Elusimicrobiota bacterium]|jgi:hypothetical protein
MLPSSSCLAVEKASADTVKMVEYFLKAQTADLPAEKVPDFLAVDPASLPAKLQPGWAAKRQELLALKKVAEGTRKPPIRRMNAPPAQCEAMRGDPRMLKALKEVSGFGEITDDELAFVMEKTKCSDCELQEEFTLIVFLLDKGPKKKPERILLMHQNDICMAIIARYRAGKKGNLQGSEFFSIGMAPACH